MREVKLSNGTIVTVRGLRRKEVTALSKYDVGYMRCGIFSLPKEQQDEAIDAVLHTQFAPGDLDTMLNTDVLKIFNAIIQDTYSSEEEEKNLSGSGPNDQTPSE